MSKQKKLKNILALVLAATVACSSGAVMSASAAGGSDFTVTPSSSTVNLDAGDEVTVTATPDYTAPTTGSNGEAVTVSSRSVTWASGNSAYVTAARTDTADSGASTAKLTAGTLDGVAAGTTVTTAVTATFTYTLHHAAVTKTTGYTSSVIPSSEYNTAYYASGSSDWEYVSGLGDYIFVGADGNFGYTYTGSYGNQTYYKYPLLSGTSSDYDVRVWNDSSDSYRYYKLTAQTVSYAAYDENKTGSASVTVNVTQTASTSGSTTQTKTVTARKDSSGNTVKNAVGDTVYDLTLTFSGATKTFVQRQKVDVLFVVDVSGSMKWDFNTNTGSSNARLNAAKSAIIALQQTAAGKQLDARYALVKFSSTASIKSNTSTGGYWYDSGFVNDSSSAYNNLGFLLGSPSGATNYEDALTKANTILAAGTRAGSKTLVIFLTDGEPTFRNSGGSTAGMGNAYQTANLTNAEAQITKTNGIKAKANYFFAVGCGSLTGSVEIYDEYRNDTYTTTTGQAILEGLTGAFTGNTATAPNFVKLATSETQLKAIFTDIINGTTSIPCKNVTITDGVSGNIEFYNPGNLTDSQLKNLITVTKVNNSTNTAVDITASSTVNYDAATGKVTVTLPNDNSAGDGIDSSYTYKVTYPIVASESAKSYYAVNGTYPNTADTQTGDFSGQQGFYTNIQGTGMTTTPAGTYVTYTSGTTTTNVAYRMPVIQIDTGSITVNKTFTGLADSVTKPTVTFTATAATLKAADGTTAFSKQASVSANGGSYTAKFENLPYDTYTVTEDSGTAHVENYTCTVTNGSSDVTLSSAGSAVSVTNAYTKDNEPDTPYLTVTKTFSGITKDSIPSDFSITVKEQGGAKPIATLNASSPNLTKSADELTWTWKVMLDSALFSNLASKTFTVTENGAAVAGYTLTASINGTAVTPAADGSVTETAAVRPSQISFAITQKVPNCNQQTFNIGNDVTFIAAQLTESYGYFVWTKDELTANERIAAVAFMSSQNAGFTQATLSNTYFFHGDSLTGNQYLVFRGAQVRYDLSDGTLKFSATKQWAKFIYGSYANKTGDNPEMAFTNSYALQTGTVTVTKAVSGITAASEKPETLTYTLTGTALINEQITRSLTVTRNADGTYPPAQFTNLPYGSYTVTEGDATVANYTLTGTTYSPAANVTLNSANAAVAVTNTYGLKTGTLSVTKTVEGIADNSLKPASITFTVAGTTLENAAVSQTLTVTKQADGTYSTASVQLPYGSYTVTENSTGMTVADYNLTGIRCSLDGAAAVKDNATQQFALRENPRTVAFTNTYALQVLTLTLKKVDGANNSALAGAKFTLSRWNGTAWTAYTTAANATGEYTVIPETGVALSDLPNGYYRLVESYVPAGYTKAADIYFQTSGGTTAALTDANRQALPGQQGVTLDGTKLILTVADYKQGFTLPETGGAGTTVFRIVGIIILVGAAVGLGFYLAKSRKKKHDAAQK